MAKLTLSDLANLQNEATAVATLASNNALTETALENTLSRDGTSPNMMAADLDMNSNSILNLPSPTVSTEPVTLGFAETNYGEALAYSTAAAASAAAALVSENNAAADAVSTAADAVSTAADVITAAASEVAAAASAVTAANNATVVAGSKWNFEASTTMAAPAVGGLRFNNATVASVTAISVNAQDAETGNPDISNYIVTWDDSTNTNKGFLVIRKFGAPNIFVIFSITSVTDNTSWLQLAVTHVASSGTWSAADEMSVGFTRAGDKGADGTMTGPGVSVDSEIALFDGIGGSTLKRASTTGILKGTSGVLSAAVSGTDYAPATSGTSILKGNGSGGFSNASAGTDYQAADAQLFSNIPQNSKSAAYTTVLTDGQKHIFHPSADVTARTFTIDSNANVAYPLGTAITFVNQNGAGVVTIAITTDTMRLAGAGTTGNRTLAANGIATAIKIDTTEWIISGTGLT
jgi:hypothetical protein